MGIKKGAALRPPQVEYATREEPREADRPDATPPNRVTVNSDFAVDKY